MARPFDRAEIPASPDLRFEAALWQSGAALVAGIDEAGRGAWAGPVAAGAVILPPDPEIAMHLAGVRDSKQMLPAARVHWAEQIRLYARSWGVGLASSVEIDALGIVPATMLAMRRALAAMELSPDHCLVDALTLRAITIQQTALVKGDARSLSIAAASVLAKTTRDALMAAYDTQYPGYGFAQHKGYGTAAHWTVLLECGPTPIHRGSFAPVARCAHNE